MTGIELNEKLALFYAEYRGTDHLLCHDDELEGRRVAFIIYLAPDWSEVDGGSLDLFSVGKGTRRAERSLSSSQLLKDQRRTATAFTSFL